MNGLVRLRAEYADWARIANRFAKYLIEEHARKL